MDENLLTTEHIEYLLKHYPVLWEIRQCIREFRGIFNRFHMPRLYLFLEHYSNSQIPEIKSFAKGLIRDLNAVENAVAPNLSRIM